MTVENITLIPGFFKITEDGGREHLIAVTDILRAADIPVGLTFSQVAAVTSLANLIAVLIRTLIDRQVLDESFLEHDDLDLDHIIYSIEQMGGAYHNPDISVS